MSDNTENALPSVAEVCDALMRDSGFITITIARPRNPNKGFTETDEFVFSPVWFHPSILKILHPSDIPAGNSEIVTSIVTPQGPVNWVAVETVQEILRRVAISRARLQMSTIEEGEA